MDVCRIDTRSITRGKRGGYNAAVRDLREVGATPAEVRRRAAIYRAMFPNAVLTPTALSCQWAQCDQAPTSSVKPGGSNFDGHLQLIEQLGAETR